MIISVHVPKTAGSSFSRTLQDIYGNTLFLDYNDAHITSPREFIFARIKDRLMNLKQKILQSNIDCIHGHFLPIKYYLLFPKAKYIVWLRDPVQRIVSLHNFIKRIDVNQNLEHLKKLNSANKLNTETGENIINLYKKNKIIKAYKNNNLQTCIMNNLTVINTYNKYLKHFNLSKFFFIGITEEYEKSISLFKKMFNIEKNITYYNENTNPKKKKPYYEIDKTLQQIIEKQNSLDIKIYQKAKNIFYELCKKYSI